MGRQYTFKTTIQVNGEPTDRKALNIVYINDNVIQIHQRMFTDKPNRFETVLRKFKGMYYIERAVALKHKTLEMINYAFENYTSLKDRTNRTADTR